ncbi:uncharacterized protein LOC113514588 [Galleria mellonella]|uniref:Uncharacterized protein LOC113514588 n=1 Tax=Galleria mellonella TaxID=7137 RepID=A0A6J1WJS7_GALME|nr:uncharacterized protein LOC113514588 [Galleria mellonella]
MSRLYTTPTLRVRIAREAQLYAEKKWILEALKKIKTQRNSLQIERLQLEGMKVSLKQEIQMEKQKGKKVETGESSSSATLLQKTPNITSTQIIEYEHTQNIEDLEALCNEEELNLVVHGTGSSNINNSDFCIEEDEEDNEDNCDDVLIDMNMFMNGQL